MRGSIHQQPALLWHQQRVGSAATGKAAWEQVQNDFILELQLLLTIDLATLLGLNQGNTLVQCLAHHTAGQNTLFLQQVDQHEAVAAEYQHLVSFAHRCAPAAATQFLAATGGEWMF